MDLPDRDFFADIAGEQPEDDFISELNEETRAVEETEVEDVSDVPGFEGTDVEDTDAPAAEPQQKRFCTYEEEAALYVNLLSDSQKVMLPKLLEKRIITDEDKERFERLENLKEPAELTDKDNKTLQKYSFLDEYKTNVALTDDEKETIKKPLAACLEMWQSSPSPTYALMFAIVTVEFSRVMPFFSNDFKK